MVDGDGGLRISGNTPQLNLCGSQKMMEQFLSFANKHTDTPAGICPHGSISRVYLCGKHAVKIIKLLYYLGCVSLERKQEKGKKLWLNFEF